VYYGARPDVFGLESKSADVGERLTGADVVETEREREREIYWMGRLSFTDQSNERDERSVGSPWLGERI
jgi:hypothetical protein